MPSPSSSTRRSLASTGTTQILQSPSSPPLSYLSARRPSLPQNGYQVRDDATSFQTFSSTRKETAHEPGSSDGDGKSKDIFQIDMKVMVGDSVGNMSISPTGRDIVLAARKGLFIIDLEEPTTTPRFLPQGGTWDVADVQWNPNPSHAEYIVSTSSERMLIWNLLLVNKTSIEFILQAHYRSITDINWHTFDPDLVCSTGIDSWIWAWDIRQPQKPAFGLCAFNAGGTQVKWNRKDANILASSHLDEVLIWDRRKGSIPVSRVKAHDGKIYGIDWSHSRRNEIITCSLDKTIKIWDTSRLQSSSPVPLQTLQTSWPVWRARDLPFGNGVLSVPQRGEPVLELWNYEDEKAPIHTFEGHTDVVKEFVWRARDGGGLGDKGVELITWSKDKTLRSCLIGRDVIQKAGTPLESKGTNFRPRQRDESVSFRAQPSGTGALPALSAPTGARTILAGVRASLPAQNNPIRLPHHGSAARARHELVKEKEELLNPPQRVSASIAADRRDGTMSKGNTKGGKSRVDSQLWLSSFRPEGTEQSRLSSGSPRRPSSSRRDVSNLGSRSSSRGRSEDAPRESDSSATLLDEINAAVNKLTPTKVKLERYGLTKHRTCTFGLHGPWGESSTVNVFVRVTFTFPKDYPHAKHPHGTPVVEIERSPLISVKRRAYMQRKLREIRETRRPCLEACLRFLLTGGDGRGGKKLGLDSGTSSDEAEQPEVEKGKDFSASLIRDNPNLAEPRSSQGVFGPNGQLVCIFRSLPRLVRTVPQDLSATPALPSRESDGVPRLFRSPLQLSDAVRRLAIAANDHSYDFLDSRDAEDMESILRIMNNLLSFSQPKQSSSEPARPDNAQNNYSLLPKRLTIVFVKDRSSVVGAHRGLAAEYVFNVEDPVTFCTSNAEVARRHYRHDHERVFLSLAAIFREQGVSREGTPSPTLAAKHPGFKYTGLLIEMLHSQLLDLKDVQILAMFAVAVSQLGASNFRTRKAVPRDKGGRTTLSCASESQTSDYFSVKKRKSTRIVSPTFVRATHSPISPVTPAVGQSYGSSTSSRGSWSSLFNAGTVRHLIGSNQEQVRKEPSPIEKVTITSSGNSLPRGKRITFSRKNVTKQHHFPDSQLSGNSTVSRSQLLSHVHAYAEMLHGWQLLQKRAELYKAVKTSDPSSLDLDPSGFGVTSLCTKCSSELGGHACPYCSMKSYPSCIVCRAPVKGISHICIVCCHIAHLRCWNLQRFRHCPSGCGCECSDKRIYPV